MSLLSAVMRAELKLRYQAAERHYHGLKHIEALLKLLDENRAEFADPDAVEAAIWFHDAIYDSRAKDNEAQSAALAEKTLKDSVSIPRLAGIVAMIEATATHQVPELEDTAARQDAALFLDMDLSILGAPPDVFDAYEAATRREYDWVSEADWRAGRGAVLRNFLARPRIYHTDLFADRFEALARANMTRSLERLAG